MDIVTFALAKKMAYSVSTDGQLEELQAVKKRMTNIENEVKTIKGELEYTVVALPEDEITL